MSSLPDGPGFNHSESDIAKCILPIFDEYHNNWVYKTRDSIINYLPNGKSLTEVSHYSYDNPSHLQLTKKTTVNSKGDKIENKYYYPGDEAQLGGYSPTELSAINLLKGSELHKTSSLLQAETYCNDVKMQVVKNCYKDWGNNHVLLERVLESKQGDNLKEKQKVIKYDKNSNVNEIADASGIRTVVLWGYDYKYPVAKIINSTYADVMGYLGRSANDDLNYLQVMSSDQLKVELNKIRNNAGSSQVSTYTYAPLIGLTSETDPNGITTYYEYDNFGRLEYVKDDEGNILKKNEYYYKTN
jgi:YD repeat-containing protein